MATRLPFRLWPLTGIVVVAGTLGLTAAGQPPGTPAAPQAEPQIGDLKLPKLEKSPLAAPSPKDDPIQKLRKERYMAAYRCVEWRFEAYQAGTTQGTIDVHVESYSQLLQAELDLGPSPAERIAILERLVGLAAFSAKVDDIRFRSGRIAIQDYEKTKYEFLDVRIKLLEAKQEAAKGGRK